MAVRSVAVPPLGVTKENGSFFFAVAAERAKECKLLLFHEGKTEPEKTVFMERDGSSAVFTARVEADEGFAAYLYETDGVSFVDPYARALTGTEQFGRRKDRIRALLPKELPTGRKPLKGGSLPFSELIFYKLHVRGFTRHTSSGVANKGTFLGLTEKIPYLKELGINAVLLMPVYEFEECVEKEQPQGISQYEYTEYLKKYGQDFLLAQRELAAEPKEVKREPEKVNYWGYAKKSFYFAPKASYAASAGEACAEWAACVDALHEAGIAVFVEFIFSQGTKQSLITDCLRFWVREYAVDGFRINAEAVPMSFLLEDPYLSSTRFLVTSYEEASLNEKTAGTVCGQRVAEYNDGFQNVIRRYVKGDESMTGEFFYRMVKNGEKLAQIHYLADHNGFSLYDVYAYDRKHNEANQEENRDGAEYNYSWNCGEEGETKKKKVRALRETMRKNALLALFLAQGTPMLMAGDEFCHTKEGNNNAYCQDNALSWLNWKWNKEKQEQISYVKKLIAFRKEHKILHSGRVLSGTDYLSFGLPDVSYHGLQLWKPDYAPYNRMTGLLLCGAYARKDRKTPDEDLYLIMNMHWEPHTFALPPALQGTRWELVVCTDGMGEGGLCTEREDGAAFSLKARSAALFCRKKVS